MADLLITLSNGQTLRHELGAQTEVLGRDRACDIFLDDPSTSRRHARVVPTAEGYLVEDLGSKNGTLVNGVTCGSKALNDGDQILLGTVVVDYSTTDPSSGSVVIEEDRATTQAPHYISHKRAPVLPQRRLQMIYDLSDRLTRLQDRNSLLEEALSICCEVLDFERGAIGVRRPNQRQVDWPVVRHLRGTEGELKISRSILNRALEHGERAVFTDSDARADPTVSIVQQGIRSAMCVPLMHEDDIMGVIYGDRLSSAEVYTAEDMDFLAGIARQVSIGLVNSFLLEDQKQMLRMQQDLDVARSIQRGLFPKHLPQSATLSVEALNDPGDRVSGDYYDMIERADGRVWLLMADVTGEGIPAALLMANLQAAVRVTITDSDDPGALLACWNKQVYRNTDPSKFVTCVAALIDPAHGSISFATAGHPPPLLLHDAARKPVELIGASSMPLGIREDEPFETTTIKVGHSPFALLCYTDGVIEAMNTEGELFGKPQLDKVLAGRRDLNPKRLIKQVREAVAEFTGGAPQSDDITILAARVGS